jgi:glycosyltransferase involved in cell wall biosynthesis
MLSVIVITKNEAQHIARCLQSIAWADEIIVLDSGSDDDTVNICKRFTEQVFVTDWPGFGPQKQRALDTETGNTKGHASI